MYFIQINYYNTFDFNYEIMIKLIFANLIFYFNFVI